MVGWLFQPRADRGTFNEQEDHHQRADSISMGSRMWRGPRRGHPIELETEFRNSIQYQLFAYIISFLSSSFILPCQHLFDLVPRKDDWRGKSRALKLIP